MCGATFVRKPDADRLLYGSAGGLGNANSGGNAMGERPAWRSLVFRVAGAIIRCVPHARRDPCAVGFCS